jgi:hypothetical protein
MVNGKALARAVLMLGMCTAWTAPTWAAGCMEEVRRLADAHGIATDPPTVAPDEKKPERKLKPDDLAKSGGVIEPPVTNDRSVITPPPSASRMPTLPDIATPAPMKKDRSKSGLSAPDMTTLQGLLVAARAEAEQGKEAACQERVDKARELVARAD